MDKLIEFLKSLYEYVETTAGSNDKGKTTVITATNSKTSIGLPPNTLDSVKIEVSGDNTLVAFYGNSQIYDTMSVPDFAPYLKKFMSGVIAETLMEFNFQAPQTEATPTQTVFGISSSDAKRIVEAAVHKPRILLPHRVKPISPIKPIVRVNPIKPVRPINPWRSIKIKEIKKT